MRVCFVVSDLGRSGGVATVVGHAERLRALGEFEVDLVHSGDGEPDAGLVPLREACAREYEVAIGTWWETAGALGQLRAGRRVFFVQSAEEYFYGLEEPLERLGAAQALDAADGYIVISGWLEDLVRELYPEAPCRRVPNGIDKTVFDGSRGPDAETLRVLIEGQPTMPLKGVDAALDAAKAADVPLEVTVVCPDPQSARGVDAAVVGGLEPRELAELLGRTDVLLKLSRLEGLGLVPLEGFHHGVPCVTTPYGGDREYLEHGVNGVRVGFDDLPRVTRWLERLSADRDLLARLRRGALETAAGWPGPDDATERFAAALRELAGAERAQPSDGMAAWRVAAEQDRVVRRGARRRLEELSGALEWHEEALAEARERVAALGGDLDRLNALVAELEQSRKDVNELLLQREAQIEEIEASRAYRAAVAARSAAERFRR